MSNMKVSKEYFVEECRRRNLNVNADKSNVMVEEMEERSRNYVSVDGRELK